MLKQKIRRDHKADHQEGFIISAVHCKLFADSITAKLCMIRKKELGSRGGFSCFGCSMAKI